jgi:hypothetical protein
MTHPYPLGRRREGDPKNAQFPMRAVLPPAITIPDYRYWYAYRHYLDQTGDTCVANAWAHFMVDSPRTHHMADLNSDKDGWVGNWAESYVSAQSGEAGFRGWLYDQAQANDPWSDTPPEGGTSVEAAARILRNVGAIASFHWATSINDIIMAVLTTSPVIVGTAWYTEMFYPKGSDMMLSPTGSIAGGHAWKLDGYNQRTGVFRMKNSWGRGWGDNGFAHIKADDVRRLVFEGDGEACLALEP